MSLAYAEPVEATRPEECFFYHSMELPSFGEIKGNWDLREVAHAYLGNLDFSAKRVLDVGTASGFLTFEMEKRGAEVVSFDLDDGANWDIVPHYAIRGELPKIRAAQGATLVRMKKAYWLSHKDLGSSARAYYGNIYEIPKALGGFDVVYYGMVVGHLRDVFQALYSGARLCTETMVVTSIFTDTENPVVRFRPSPTDFSNFAIKSWWGLNIGTMRSMLGVLGFEIVDIVKSRPLCLNPAFKGRHDCTAIVARRQGV